GQAGIPASALAAVALPLGHRGRPWRVQPDRAMQPASTMKLVTSVVALDRLRATHRGYTEFRSAAPLQGGVLRGALVLKGGADPDLSVPVFWDLLQDLRLHGVQSIEGDLIVDRTRFHPSRIDQGLVPFDEAFEFPSNVIPDALLLAGDLLPMALHAGANGAVRGVTVPLLAGVAFDSRMGLSDKPCKDWDDDWLPATVTTTEDSKGSASRIELHGSFPRNCTQRVALQLIDRQVLTEQLFRSLWQGMGGSWNGRARERPDARTGAAADPSAAAEIAAERVLARHDARPWGEVLRPMNKQSDNAIARLLFLELGAVADSAGTAPASTSVTTTLEQARAETLRWFTAHHIDTRGLVLDNGSGLSRSARITPRQLAQLLRVAWSDPQAPDLLASLPVAGVDGTMRRRLKDSAATGVARLKSGTLRNVTAVAGIVADDKGRPWAVAALVNDDNAPRARAALDALIDGIARFGPHGRAPMRVGPQGNGP
ncbi:MAG: D-alanyl-D-alanine carboxypeptidase, partial [Pseudomonadota bacterium]|nr:D-alanyl-D-alanine carboxypeptidase [Pseudomonadota bacterium]